MGMILQSVAYWGGGRANAHFSLCRYTELIIKEICQVYLRPKQVTMMWLPSPVLSHLLSKQTGGIKSQSKQEVTLAPMQLFSAQFQR